METLRSLEGPSRAQGSRPSTVLPRAVAGLSPPPGPDLSVVHPRCPPRTTAGPSEDDQRPIPLSATVANESKRRSRSLDGCDEGSWMSLGRVPKGAGSQVEAVGAGAVNGGGFRGLLDVRDSAGRCRLVRRELGKHGTVGRRGDSRPRSCHAWAAHRSCLLDSSPFGGIHCPSRSWCSRIPIGIKVINERG